MGFADRVKNNILFVIPSSETVKEKVKEGSERILRPESFKKWTDGPEDRMMQILSLFLIGPVIVVSLVCIVVINETMSELFGISNYDNNSQAGIIGWFVTAVTGGLFLLAAWSWFQFVRTYGFGIFRWD